MATADEKASAARRDSQKGERYAGTEGTTFSSTSETDCPVSLRPHGSNVCGSKSGSGLRSVRGIEKSFGVGLLPEAVGISTQSPPKVQRVLSQNRNRCSYSY